jgi:putative acetyltransferase
MIRKHHESDLKVILGIWSQASSLAHPFLDPIFTEKVRKDMQEIYIPGSETWVYEENAEVVGFISMLGNEIGGLFVLPVYHSKGIGTRLVNYVKRHHSSLEVEAFEKNKIGRAFYDGFGFVVFSKYFHKESGQNILRMNLLRKDE